MNKRFFLVALLLLIVTFVFADIVLPGGTWLHYKKNAFGGYTYVGKVEFYSDGTFIEKTALSQQSGTYTFNQTTITMDYPGTANDFTGAVTESDEDLFYVDSTVDRKFVRNPLGN